MRGVRAIIQKCGGLLQLQQSSTPPDDDTGQAHIDVDRTGSHICIDASMSMIS